MKSSIASGESRGSVPNILLKALQSGDKYGYEINKEIETKSKGKYFLKEASLYSGLKRLEASGHITSYWKDGELGIRRHYYSITPLGIAKLNNSKFTWDDSKNFMIEIFNDYKTRDNLQNKPLNQDTTIQNGNDFNSPTQNQTISNENNDNSISNKTLVTSNEIINKPEVQNREIKKNPFQIEVNPLQQSIFDFGFSNASSEEKINEKTSEEKNIVIETNEEKENKAIEETNSEIQVKEIKIENVVETKTIEETSEIKANTNENEVNVINNANTKTKSRQISYEELLNNYNANSYSSNLDEVNEKIDISKYLTRDKENDSSIIISNTQNNEKSEIIDNSININNESGEIKHSPTLSENINVENNNGLEKKNDQVDIKNIFGSLLVDDKQDEKNIEDNIEIPVTEESHEIERPALPRINVDNDVNIMFNSNSVKSKSSFEQTTSNENYIRNNTTSSPTVRQYINNVHKKTLISRATSVEQEVNLEGINIREYQKMNNKIIKNSNYVYINKLNFFLVILFASIVILESVVSFVVLNNNKSLGVFEILLLSGLILATLIFSYFSALSYFKDKFKVELKNYNFKSSIFYLSLIFVVATIIFVCINIFQGMNTSNFANFMAKMLMETLITLNLVLIPLVKLWFYNVKIFSN